MEIEKQNLQSLNITAEQLSKLRSLFPEVFTEYNKIDWDLLRLTLGEQIDTGRERYGMQWPGKADCFRTIQQPSIATLIPDREQSVDFDTTQHLFIEGDNLEVLKLLQKSYLGKVKMIYIDPPYNTGKEFIYPDNYSESLETYLSYTSQTDDQGRRWATNSDTDGRYHSKWISMMYPRLFLAKNLLREDGVIFISIDDHEVSNLRKICDEIFGEENFMASIIWQHSIQPKGYIDKFSVHHNYILLYSKSEDFELSTTERTDEHNKNYNNPDNDPNGDWRSGDVRNALYRPNLIFKITTPTGKIIDPPKNGWRWSKETISQKISTGEIIFSKDESRIIRKIYLKNVEGRAPETIWFGKEFGTTRDASEEVKKLFNGINYFDTPKPSKLISSIVKLGASQDDIILDFFAGSATTAHAVLDLNKEDGGSRKFICVQIPEPTDTESEAYKAGYHTIADISKERIRRVIQNIHTEIKDKKAKEDASLFEQDGNQTQQDLGFKVFKLAASNFDLWDSTPGRDPSTLEKNLFDHVHHLSGTSAQEAILYEIILKAGFELNTPIVKHDIHGHTVYDIQDGGLYICLDKSLDHDTLKAIAERQPVRFICLDEAFGGDDADALKTNAVQIMKSKDVVFRTV